jgi:hypothetical protein
MGPVNSSFSKGEPLEKLPKHIINFFLIIVNLREQLHYLRSDNYMYISIR